MVLAMNCCLKSPIAQELSLGVIIDLLGANLVEQRTIAIVQELDQLGTEGQHVGDRAMSSRKPLLPAYSVHDLLDDVKAL